jgi:hypothetical protein
VPALPLPVTSTGHVYVASLILNAAQERCMCIEIGSATCLCSCTLGENTNNNKKKRERQYWMHPMLEGSFYTLFENITSGFIP